MRLQTITCMTNFFRPAGGLIIEVLLYYCGLYEIFDTVFSLDYCRCGLQEAGCNEHSRCPGVCCYCAQGGRALQLCGVSTRGLTTKRTSTHAHASSLALVLCVCSSVCERAGAYLVGPINENLPLYHVKQRVVFTRSIHFLYTDQNKC